MRKNPLVFIHEARVVAKILRAGIYFYDGDLRRLGAEFDLLRRHSKKLTRCREAQAEKEIIQWLSRTGLRWPRSTLSPAVIRPGRSERKSVLKICEMAEALWPFLKKKSKTAHPLKFGRLKNADDRYRRRPCRENLHRLRKRAKELQYQMQWFAPPAAVSKKEIDALISAGRHLGRARDLDLLRASLRRRGLLDARLDRKLRLRCDSERVRGLRNLESIRVAAFDRE